MAEGKVLFPNGEYEVKINIEAGYMGENEIVIHMPKDADTLNWYHAVTIIKDL